MPATDYQGSFPSSPLTSFGRSIFTFGRSDPHVSSSSSPSSMDARDPGHVLELEAFQSHVSDQFTELMSYTDADFLSLAWVRRLLDVFVSCHVEFLNLLANHDYCLNQPPMDRLIAEFHERSVKALDVCNAIRDGIEQIRQWERLLQIVLSALDNTNTSTNTNHNANPNQKQSLGEAQIRRAKKALIDLLIGMLDDQKLSHRNRSFGRNKIQNSQNNTHLRSLSWSVSRSWSAAKQLQAMWHNLHPPRGSGLSMAVYTMSAVLAVVMSAVAAAVPCRGLGLQQVVLPRQMGWARAVLGVHDRVVEESKKRERRNNCGMLREIGWIERWAREMNDVLEERNEGEVRKRVGELRGVLEGMKDGLMPLECKVREVFHRIVKSRTQGMMV